MTKKALCLSGGGARGSFQMGAVRCLYEVYGFRPDVIAGTSVGSVNGIKLAAAPPPTVNDAQAILTAVSNGTIDSQLKQMRSLEQLWLAFLTPSNFFNVRAPFKGTMIEDAVRDMNSSTYSGPLNTTINPQIDDLSAFINIPLLHIFAGIKGAVELQKIRDLIEKISVENSFLDLKPIEDQLNDSNNLNMDDLAMGTPFYMAMVALETGKLRYVTNKGEFYERDGITPVATALMDSDIDDARDENGQRLIPERKNNIKTVVAGYKAAATEIATCRAEYNLQNTTTSRRRVLSELIQAAAERGNYYSRAAKAQIKTVKLTAKVSPVTGVLASACLPIYFEPQVVGVERYVDGGIREIIPVEVVLRHNVDQLVGIVCSANELPETDSLERAGVISVGMRSMLDIALEEVVIGDLAAAESKGIDVRYILPMFNVHDTVVVQPSLIEISMHYGWMRTADEMHPAAAEERPVFRQSSELIARLRLKCLEIERQVDTNGSLNPNLAVGRKWDYFELRVNRWAIMHVAARRTAMGLPQHPAQATWATDWEREFRGASPWHLFPSVWTKLEVRSSDNTVLDDMWPASSPAEFNPDIHAIRDAGSQRTYWMVRGAIFEDNSGTPPDRGTISLPSGTHQFLPRIPSGLHLMAETQSPGTTWLVAGQKKYASPSPQIVAAAGLTGSPVALVPTGGMAQIPDGGIPTFLGSLSVVDQTNRPLTEIVIERLDQSNTIADISICNRSTVALTGILVAPVGFDALAGISVESAPANIGKNTIDLVTLRLRPTCSGEYNGEIVINSSDPLFPSITVPLKLKVLSLGNMAYLEFKPNPLVINARVNSTTSYSMLTVTNTGAIAPTTLSASIEPVAAQSLFVVGQYLNAAAFTPGRAVQLPVFFYPTAAGPFSAELVLDFGGNTSNNNPYQRTVRIPLSGNAGASKIGLSKRRKKPARPPILRPPVLRIPGDLGGIAIPQLDPLQTSIRIDLGTIQPAVDNATSFFISNTGDLPLEITTILSYYASVNTGTNLAFPLTIPPGQQTEIPLDFGMYHAPGIGQFTETIRILCDDPVTPEATAILIGAIGGTNARINPEYIDFSTIPLNTVVRKTIAFENNGTVDLHIKKIDWQSGIEFRIVQPPAVASTVAAGASLAIEIEFLSSVPGYHSDRFTIDTDEGISSGFGMQARAI